MLNCKIPSEDRTVAVWVTIQKGFDIIKQKYIFIETNEKFKKYSVDKYIFRDGSHFLTCSAWDA